MAGYYLSSLDSEGLVKFLDSPSEKQIQRIVKFLLKQWKTEKYLWEEDGTMKTWPKTESELAVTVEKHLEKDDWYSELNSTEYFASQASCWEFAITSIFETDKSFKLKALVDPIYWNVVDEVVNFHKSQGTNCEEFSGFGKRPLRYSMPDEIGEDEWFPYHSVHKPNEVEQMALQCLDAEPAMANSRHNEVPREYKRLCKAFEMLKKSKRVLYVTVDT